MRGSVLVTWMDGKQEKYTGEIRSDGHELTVLVSRGEWYKIPLASVRVYWVERG